jgi:hypothetical protein
MNLNIDPVITHWFRRARNKFPSAIIAGGYLRDLYFGKDYSDVDIFVRRPSGISSQKQLESTIHSIFDNEAMVEVVFNKRVSNQDPYGNSAYYHRLHIEGLVDVYHHGSKFQIVILDKQPIEYVTKYFDVGICQCYFDGTRIHYTDNFITDAVNRTITICGDLSYEEFHYCLNNHIPRIQWKYGDFAVKIAPKLKHYNQIPF